MRSHHFISDLLFCNSTSSKSVTNSFNVYPHLSLGQTSTVDGALSELWFPAAYIIIVYFKDLSLNSRYSLYSVPLTLSMTASWGKKKNVKQGIKLCPFPKSKRPANVYTHLYLFPAVSEKECLPMETNTIILALEIKLSHVLKAS